MAEWGDEVKLENQTGISGFRKNYQLFASIRIWSEAKTFENKLLPYLKSPILHSK